MGSITKVTSMKIKNVTSRFCPFFPLEWSSDQLDELLPISALSYSRIASCSASAFLSLSLSVSKCSHAFCHARGDRQMTSLTQLLRSPGQMPGAKIMAPNWRHVRDKTFPCEWASKTSQNHTPSLQLLDCCWFDPKEKRKRAAFQFSRTRNKWMYYNSYTENFPWPPLMNSASKLLP